MEKTKIIWIAFSVPSVKVGHAGGKTFRYYFDAFVRDDRFDIKLIGFPEDIDERVLNDEFCNIAHKFIPRGNKLKERIVNWRDIFGKICPYGKYGGLILQSRADKVMEYLNEYKKDGCSPDVIILEWTAMVVLANEVRKIFPETVIYMSEHDVTFQSAYRKVKTAQGFHVLLRKLSAQRLKSVELEALHNGNIAVVHNKKDRNILQKAGIRKERIFQISPYYHRSPCVRKRRNNDLIYFGYMKRKENVLAVKWFINNVMPLIKDLDCNFIVLGSGGKEALKDIKDSRVKVVGFVESIDEWFSAGMCLVAPLTQGAGIKVKVIEGMYSGIPVLTNSIGIEGIPAKDRESYFHCESGKDYEKVIRCLYNREFDEKHMQVEARKVVEKYFDIEESARLYKENILRAARKLF